MIVPVTKFEDEDDQQKQCWAVAAREMKPAGRPGSFTTASVLSQK
jgi:hypothetical protein